jgi:mannose-6-phosphate isomerase-like protein (cupin superfamily)
MDANSHRHMDPTPARDSRVSDQPATHNFHSLDDVLRAIAAHPLEPDVASAARPLFMGEFAAAGIVRFTESSLRLHRQPNHEELLIVLEGETDFRVGDEVRHVRRGDFIVVPRNGLHGSVTRQYGPVSYLSIFSPKIDLARDVVWEGEGAPPRYELV